MNRVCKLPLVGFLVLLFVVSASPAEEPLTFKKDFKFDDAMRKEIGGKNLTLVDLIMVGDNAFISLVQTGDSHRLVRIDTDTGGCIVSAEVKIGWSEKPLFQYGDHVWLSSSMQGFKHADLRPAGFAKKKGKATGLETTSDAYYLTQTGKLVWQEVTREDGKIKFAFKKHEPETGSFATKTVTANQKGRKDELRKRACDFPSMTFLYAEMPARDIPDEFVHWFVRPNTEKDGAISIKLPAPASRMVAVDETLFLIGTDAGSLHLLDVTQPDKMTLIDAKFDYTVNDLEISKDKRFAFATSLDRKKDNLILIDLETKKVIQRQQLKQNSLHSIGLSANEKLLAVCNGTDTITLFEVNLPAKK